MDLFRLTRELVDIESVSGNEGAVGEFLVETLSGLGWNVERLAVEPGRFNVFARPAEVAAPAIVFSTHMDVVPPWFGSREDGERIYGRGACDAKGIMAAQIAAAERLRAASGSVGLLFTVGEERDSAGAKCANAHAPGSVFLVNGEPTENRLASATKGSLHVDVRARGKLAHSAYPELGESAIEKLLDALARLRAMQLPRSDEFGATTLNIGLIRGGRAPNVVPDEATANLLLRTVAPAEELKREIQMRCDGLVEVSFPAESPFVRLRTVPGIETMVASFSTDIPHLANWGEPLLLGPGSIHVAHTREEHISKRELTEAVDLYVNVARALLNG